MLRYFPLNRSIRFIDSSYFAEDKSSRSPSWYNDRLSLEIRHVNRRRSWHRRNCDGYRLARSIPDNAGGGTSFLSAFDETNDTDIGVSLTTPGWRPTIGSISSNGAETPRIGDADGLAREHGSSDPEVDGRPVGVSNVGSIGGGARRDATGQRCPAARPPTPCASSARLAPRRSQTVDHHVRGAGVSRNASSPSAAAEAPGSPRSIPDGRGAPTPVRGRRRGVAPACIDRGWRRCEKSTGTSSGEGHTGEPDVGLDADPRRAEERRASGRPINDCTDS